MLDKKRRPKTHLSDDETQIIEDAYNESFLGARLLRHNIQKHYKRNISHNKIHQHLLEMGLARPNLKKQKKRKRCRYERKHSLSLVHADWLDYEGTQVIAYEDDTSRKILSIGEFTNATTDNALSVFKHAEDVAMAYRVKITAVNTNRGTQFYASGGFWSTEDIGGGLILRMRLQSGTITVSMGHLTWNTLKLRMMLLSGK